MWCICFLGLLHISKNQKLGGLKQYTVYYLTIPETGNSKSLCFQGHHVKNWLFKNVVLRPVASASLETLLELLMRGPPHRLKQDLALTNSVG